ncbi:MAG: restriction endonuclease [Spirulinaceae cyanobacterium SM2_1_0]|nr:restriction endonuclease [Spirulinaceae cyanobacterium SM2_1_0]
MTDFLSVEALVEGILQAGSGTKQVLGQRFASHLGLEPGKQGGDGGIDGFGQVGACRVYFQSKLERQPLDASRAAEFYGNIVNRADVGVLLSGLPCTLGFRDRLEILDPKLHERFAIHLLSLGDLFGESAAFRRAIADLHPLRDLSDGGWRSLLP